MSPTEREPHQYYPPSEGAGFATPDINGTPEHNPSIGFMVTGAPDWAGLEKGTPFSKREALENAGLIQARALNAGLPDPLEEDTLKRLRLGQATFADLQAVGLAPLEPPMGLHSDVEEATIHDTTPLEPRTHDEPRVDSEDSSKPDEVSKLSAAASLQAHFAVRDMSTAAGIAFRMIKEEFPESDPASADDETGSRVKSRVTTDLTTQEHTDQRAKEMRDLLDAEAEGTVPAEPYHPEDARRQEVLKTIHKRNRDDNQGGTQTHNRYKGPEPRYARRRAQGYSSVD
jgi:hypothetical protein